MSLSRCRVLCFRLSAGQELVTEVTARCREAALQAAFVVTCVGSTSACRLRLASTPDGRTENFVSSSDFMEICSLVGTVSGSGVHLHVTLGRADGSALAGHVVSLTVQTTAEVVLGEAEQLVFDREPDTRTGYCELVVRNRTSINWLWRTVPEAGQLMFDGEPETQTGYCELVVRNRTP
ncbi:bifunctional protein GlmU-like [Pollicipes pollicipes]|uniref:bifunctional protein GlmU-like n=1 Tax=Pollicipes pollicipes TaxID=41117 RepID=UPI001884BFEB|nr:bifunctional protein GlmU-like [Pollicipes pollicipes]